MVMVFGSSLFVFERVLEAGGEYCVAVNRGGSQDSPSVRIC